MYFPYVMILANSSRTFVNRLSSSNGPLNTKALYKFLRYTVNLLICSSPSIMLIQLQEEVEPYYEAHHCFAKALHNDKESKVELWNPCVRQD